MTVSAVFGATSMCTKKKKIVTRFKKARQATMDAIPRSLKCSVTLRNTNMALLHPGFFFKERNQTI